MPPPDVSIIACTFRRPEPLQRLLESLYRQNTSLSSEVIVVDNSPGYAIPAKAKFPAARWLEEPRQGLSFARNAGLRIARAPIVVLIDDDIEAPPGWLDAIARPLVEGEFDAVTGPTIPVKLETEAERLFEAYGGHGHAFRRQQFDAAWLARQRLLLPVWRAGGLGNSAIRRSVFHDPRVGMMEELLGVGTPAGSSEDLYFFYCMMRAGYRILHEPAAAVRHAHRETLPALERQLCDYRRGEVCFCLLALRRRHDWRALTHLLVWIPYWRVTMAAREIWRRFRGLRRFSFRLMAKEAIAYASGPWALIASRRNVRRLRFHAVGERAVHKGSVLPNE